MRIVLGVSAGIAAYKAVHLVRLLRAEGHQVDVIPTPASLEFVGKATWEAISGREITTSVFEGVDEVRHVRLGQEADLVVVAPATADLLARARAGMAGDLLTSTLLATEATTLMVPAMHTEMWQHPATQDNVAALRERGVLVMDPAVGRLTGSDSGPGRLPEPEDIFARIQVLLSAPQGPLTGRKVVITAGGTREALDPVRYLGNRSSGKQGVALAEAAAAAGAQVHLIAGTMEVAAPEQHPAITVAHIETASELQAAVQGAVTDADALIMAAAVADFRPAGYSTAKIKKTDDGENPIITLERNPDILAGIVADRTAARAEAKEVASTDPKISPAVVIGFAAETGDESTDPLLLAQQKLQRKGCDFLVFNRVGENLVFGQDQTEVQVLSAGWVAEALGRASEGETEEPRCISGTKREAAELVISELSALLEVT